MRAHLAHDANGWVGRTILVRGWLVPCMAVPSAGSGPCAALVPSPRQPTIPGPWRPAIDPLTLVRGDPPPWAAFLRRLPLLDDLAPPLQVLHWGAVATYHRVRLRAVGNSLCSTGTCSEAVLLDAEPGYS